MQTMILPAACAGSRVSGPHSCASVGSAPVSATSLESRNGVDRKGASLLEAPTIFLPLPSTTVFSKLCQGEAAAFVIQGLGFSPLDGGGPSLPAEVATKIPASAAPSNAICTGSRVVLAEPPIE